MQLPLQITGRDLSLSAEEEQLIREQAGQLNDFYRGIMGCRVLVTIPNRYPAGPPVSYTVRVDLTLKGGELAVTRQPKQSLQEAVQDAFAAARRQLQDYARRQRNDVKSSRKPDRGRVSKLFAYEGYGFLDPGDGSEIYFHRNSVLNEAFDRLEVGSQVRFTLGSGAEGPQASTVSLLPRRQPRTRRQRTA
jgi:cold shock CspA family protein/ribosome-associated translation inhibitor RaiA